MSGDRTAHLVAEVAEEKVERRSFFRSLLLFLSSNIGLVILVILYSIGGAFLFILLEQYIELQNCQQAYLNENMTVTNMSETMYNYVVLTKDTKVEIYQTIDKHLKNFTDEIFSRRTQYRYTGQNCSDATGWSFPSALLFAITVITTIGYGHISPTSWEGQITCICYALIGIPIFLLCIANISSVLGDIFRYLYSAILHCFCCVCRVYTRNRRRRARQNQAGKVKNSIYVDNCVGDVPLDPSWPEVQERYRGKTVFNGFESDRTMEIDDDDDFEDDDDIWDRIESRVPFGAVIVILCGYISIGAFMFHRFEDWTMVESVYFSYITLATIGFGDFVPGIASQSTSGLRFVLASIYILFGLSILAMCFDLIKEGIVDKVRWFGHKIGIIAEEDDQIDEDQTHYATYEYEQRTEKVAKRFPPGKDDPPAYVDETNRNKKIAFNAK